MALWRKIQKIAFMTREDIIGVVIENYNTDFDSFIKRSPFCDDLVIIELQKKVDGQNFFDVYKSICEKQRVIGHNQIRNELNAWFDKIGYM